MAIIYQISDESVEIINKYFTEEYAYKQWFFKIKTWDAILDNIEEFVEKIGDSELKNEDVSSYKITIETEMVFGFYHMAEALFSLMKSYSQSDMPWLYMKNLRFKDLCDYVRETVVTGEISDEDIHFLFIQGETEDVAKKKIVVESIAFIKEFLKKMGKIFLDNELYTEYKHGLRVMPSSSQFSITSEIGKKPLFSREGNTHTYLSTKRIQKKKKKEIHKIQQKTESYDYKLYLRLSVIIYRLIHNLFDSRRQTIKLKQGELISVDMFIKDNIDEIFMYDPNKFSIIRDYH